MTPAIRDFQPIDSAVTPRFAGPATFMRTPYVPGGDGVEIALAGIPFDLGSTNRAGPRHGPAEIRDMSRLIRQVNASSRIAPFRFCRVADIGDAPVNPLALMEKIDRITGFCRDLQGVHLVGGDVCEVSPPLDPAGHTALNGANLILGILCMVAELVARRRR